MVITTHKKHAVVQQHYTTKVYRELVIRLLAGEILTVAAVRDTIPAPEGVDVDESAAGDFPGPLMRIGAVRRAGSVDVRGADGRVRSTPLWQIGNRVAAEKFFRSPGA